MLLWTCLLWPAPQLTTSWGPASAQGMAFHAEGPFLALAMKQIARELLKKPVLPSAPVEGGVAPALLGGTHQSMGSAVVGDRSIHFQALCGSCQDASVSLWDWPSLEQPARL